VLEGGEWGRDESITEGIGGVSRRFLGEKWTLLEGLLVC
jgi:hypothetical protein